MPPTSTLAPPDRSLQQRLTALSRANEIRARRAQLKRDLKGGQKSILPLLLDPPDWVESARIYELMLALPKFGRVKASKALNQVHCSPSKTISGLSDRQRVELIRHLRERGA